MDSITRLQSKPGLPMPQRQHSGSAGAVMTLMRDV